jgi:hypothetical protein
MKSKYVNCYIKITPKYLQPKNLLPGFEGVQEVFNIVGSWQLHNGKKFLASMSFV